MTQIHLLRASIILALAVPSGCMTAVSEPKEYQHGYSYVQTDRQGSEKTIGNPVLAPNACLDEPPDSEPSPSTTSMTVVSQVGPHLPVGCANAYNLQLMVERPGDLLAGRNMGAAPAALTTRAARRYIHGPDQALGGAQQADPTYGALTTN